MLGVDDGGMMNGVEVPKPRHAMKGAVDEVLHEVGQEHDRDDLDAVVELPHRRLDPRLRGDGGAIGPIISGPSSIDRENNRFRLKFIMPGGYILKS